MSDRPKQLEMNTKLLNLQAAHRALDNRIEQLAHENAVNMLEIQRLKKQKLALKDRISLIQSQQHPDIIA